jgi:two-component system NarL family sensor kinase
LRALTNRVVQAQETERGDVALDLHDNITQLLCAILFRSRALAERLSANDGPSKSEAMQLGEMLGNAAGAVDRIYRNLRPGVLEHLGLEAVLRATGTEFAERTGISVDVACVKLKKRLPYNTEVALFRILQEILKNVELHARAHHVTVALTRSGGVLQLTIKDDGIGFDPDRHAAKQKGKGGLGLLGMLERASHLGGTFEIESSHGTGTEIKVRFPLLPPPQS